MSELEIKAGMLVIHPAKPDWGPGKVVSVNQEHVFVFWRDSEDNVVKKFVRASAKLVPAPSQTDPILDNLPPLQRDNGTFVKLPNRLTLKLAVQKFLSHFPAGFYDPKYLGTATSGERNYKWDAHIECVKRLGDGRFRKLLQADPE